MQRFDNALTMRAMLLGRWSVFALCVVGATVVASACSTLEGLDDLQVVDDLRDGSTNKDSSGLDAGGAGDAGDGATNDAGTDATPSRCPSGRGPAMVEVPTLDGRTFCIDSTETTQGQYAEFMKATAGDAGSQDPRCTWKTDYVPLCAYDPEGQKNRPVVCVDWCDALAFCHWAGKRMCGQIGGGSLPGFFGNVYDATKSQWHAACTHNGTRVYPYGTVYNPAACNTNDPEAGAPTDVGSVKGCVGGFAGLNDMSGNVQEFEDACDEVDSGPKDGRCHGRGGSWAEDTTAARCDGNGVLLIFTRDTYTDYAGIRCCAD